MKISGVLIAFFVWAMAGVLPVRAQRGDRFRGTPGADSLIVYARDSMMGYRDAWTGREVTPPRFRMACSFREGRAAVSPDGMRWGYADSTGRIVIRPQWNLVSDFREGTARVVVMARRWCLDREMTK